MKIQLIGEPKIILSNPNSTHNYFAWPTVDRLRDGRIAVAASGFRLEHICPMGKAVIAFSADEGESYTPPIPVIDTTLDDRDGGLCPFGESGLIVTSFNNKVEYQRMVNKNRFQPRKAYIDAYLDSITPEMEERDLGFTYRISRDNGATFEPMRKSPIMSPHGPVELSSGEIFWIGSDGKEPNGIHAYLFDPDSGEFTYLSTVELSGVWADGRMASEPYVVELEKDHLLCHIRIDRWDEHGCFTLYQCESFDCGRTWTTPYQVFGKDEGAPSFLYKHSSGKLICSYSYRFEPYGIRVMVSDDGGKTWSAGTQIFTCDVKTWDLGYPTTVELKDGSLLTVFYAHQGPGGPAVIWQQKWRLDFEG